MREFEEQVYACTFLIFKLEQLNGTVFLQWSIQVPQITIHLHSHTHTQHPQVWYTVKSIKYYVCMYVYTFAITVLSASPLLI